MDELRTELNITGTGDFRQALVAGRLSAEDLIRPLLAVVAPVAAMMTDLLSLYENIAARHTRSDNIRMSFNFDEDSDPVDINLDAFREWERNFHEVSRPHTSRRWNQAPAWRIAEIVDQLLPDRLVSRSVDRTEWPDIDEPCPESGIRTVDEVLARVWNLRREFLAEVSVVWPEPAERSTPVAAQAISDTTAELGELIEQLPAVRREVVQQIEDLKALLSLPVWGKRHEVYSAWVFTQIVAAIGFENLAFHVQVDF